MSIHPTIPARTRGPSPMRRALILAMALLSFATLLTAIEVGSAEPATAQAPPLNHTNALRSMNGQCLDIPRNRPWPTKALQAWHCNGTQAQLWRFHGSGQISTRGETYCLSRGADRRARLELCNPRDGKQRFLFTFGGEIIHRGTNECLAVIDPYWSAGSDVRFQKCDGRGRQRWSPSDMPARSWLCPTWSDHKSVKVRFEFFHERTRTQFYGVKVSVEPREATKRAVEWGWVDMQRCMHSLYRGGIWSWTDARGKLSPGLVNIYAQARCHAIWDARTGRAGRFWDYETWNQLPNWAPVFLPLRCGGQNRVRL